MKIDIEQLKALADHSKTVGAESACLDLAIKYAEHTVEKINKVSKLLKEASGWLGPHDHNPKELSERIEKELSA